MNDLQVITVYMPGSELLVAIIAIFMLLLAVLGIRFLLRLAQLPGY